MNKLKKASAFFLFVVLNVTVTFSQVGIGNTSPQQELHISGSSSTIRLEGLNSTNHANNTGVRDQPVFVDSNGDMKIPASPANAEILVANNNFINDASTVWVRTGTEGQGGWWELYQTSFTLTQAAVVMIDYSVSMTITNRAGTAALTDGKVRLIQNYFFMGDGTTADFSTSYGRAATFYTSGPLAGGSHFVVDGVGGNSASATILLPAGTHSIHIYGFVYGGDGVLSPRTSDAFRSTFGGGNDTLQITALY